MTSQFLNDMASLGLMQINDIKNSINRILDLCYVDDTTDCLIARCLPKVLPEDKLHLTLLVSLTNTCETLSHNESNQRSRCFKKTDLVTLRKLLDKTDWDMIIPNRIEDPKEFNDVI